MANAALIEALKDEETRKQFTLLPSDKQAAFIWRAKWLQQAHVHQIAPPGDWWSIWLLLAGRGAGKGLTLDTPIPTPNGWTLNGDLKDGDAIFDERGNICYVVKAHDPYTPKALYRLTFSDNTVIEADGEHLWTTLTHQVRKQMTRHGMKRVPDDWASYRHPLIDCHKNVTGYIGSETLQTQDIVQTFTHSSRKDLNHCIPTAQALCLPDVELPIDPYLLGAWLGDGSSKEQVIWGHIDDIGLIESHAISLGYETELIHDKGNTWKVRIFGLSKQLRKLNVYGNKHVPAIYLRASIDQRLKLLQGLMDTDGFQDKKAAEFCNTNKLIADAVYELAVSLGEKPVFKTSRAMLYGKDCGEKYRITWRWSRFNPFMMERKRSRLNEPKEQSFKHGHRMIVQVEQIETRTVRCITVDSPSRLYLAGKGMIPTHNTRTAAEQVAWWAWTEPNTRWLVAAPTSSDVRSTCFEGDSGLMSIIPQSLIQDYNKQHHELRLTNGSLIKGIPASEPERFRGPQFHGAWCCIPGTMIALPDGAKPIELIEVGDMVMTRHGIRKVLAAGVSGNPNNLVAIECGVTSLTVTEDHPILIGDDWIPAGEIKQGDYVTSSMPLEVLSVERLPNSLTYNLTVEGEHEFIANGIVVHNCDELAAWDYLQDAWDQIMFGVRLGKHTRIICTTTPKPRDLIVELVSREGDDVVLTTASTYSNLANLAPSFQKQILQYEGTKLGRQEIHAEIIDSEESGIVKRDMFKLWPVGKPFPKFEYIIQSYDCAYTEKTINDPTACLVFGMFKPLDGGMCAMLIDAWQDHLQYPDLRPKVIEEYGSVYGEGKEGKRVDLVLVEDKAAGISLIHDLQRAHIPVRAYNPGRADKVQRLSIVANIIACGKVWIPESTLKRGYVRDWAEGFVSQICSFPEAAHDDFVDACVDSSTQVTMADGSSKRIDEVIVGDFVKTPNGSKKVSAVHANGLKELWSVTVGDKTVLATANHKIQTQRGWIRVDSLTQAIDNGYLYQGDTSWHLQRSLGLLLKPLSLMASVIVDTLRAATQRTGSIFPVLDNAFTVKFGSTTMGQLKKECTSITLMATQPITAYKISNVSGVMHIGIITETHCPKEVERLSTLLTSKESDQKPASGIDQKKVKHGTESTLKTLLQRCGQSLASIRSLNLSVHGAVQHLWQKSNAKSSAAPLVKTQSQSSVLVNQVMNTHTIAQVYDLTVEDEHCYYANGILVHNCSQALRYLRDAGWLDIDGERPEPYDQDDVEDARGNRDRVNPYSA
jgi:predicted phage terminase large subunit-like protein